MSKVNCWEYEKCGREPEGNKVHELGVCPAATMKEADGFCGGTNGGRACFHITGTYCGGAIQETYEDKTATCAKCAFHKAIREEERRDSFIFAFNDYIKSRSPEQSKMNCWEHERCGREPGGKNTHELGICPAATLQKADGFCGGTNGGRACAFIPGTYCSGSKQGDYEEKLSFCFKCDFYKQLQKEEGANLSIIDYRKHSQNKK